MNLNLTGKRAVVCGSTQGIGKAAAHELALLGARVTHLARNETKLKAGVQELNKINDVQHDYIVADFSNPDEVEERIHHYASKNRAHILVNNTGGPPAGPAIEAEIAAFTQAFQNHLVCNHLLTRALVPGMKQEQYGRIINIISTSVKVPIRGLGVSNTIRGAVASWAKTLANELAPFGITVNNVLPGTTMTARLDSIIQSTAEKNGISYQEAKARMIAEVPAGRISEPHEVAAVIAFLATPAAGYITGINVPVDGGRKGSL